MEVTLADGIWQLSFDDVTAYRRALEEHLAKPCAMSSGRHTPAAILTKAKEGVYSIFVAIVNRIIRSVAVVAVNDYSASRWLTIISCGGEKMVDWLKDGRHALESFARHHQCEGIEVFGRQGWCRAMDLTPVGVWMERKL